MSVGRPDVGVYGLRFTGTPLGPTVPAGAPSAWPEVHVSTAPHPEPRLVRHIDGDRVVADLRDDLRTLVMDRRASTVQFLGPALEQDVLAHPYLGPAASVFGRWLGREAFHGGAFLTSTGTAIAVLGGQFAGKSTQLAALAAADVPIVADDLVVVEQGQVFLGPRTIDLRAEPTDGLRGGLAVSRARGETRWRLALPPIGPSHKLGGWVFLHGSDTPGSVQIESVGVAERLTRLARWRSGREFASDPRAMLDLAALPAWDLIRPLTWDALAESTRVLRNLLPPNGGHRSTECRTAVQFQRYGLVVSQRIEKPALILAMSLGVLLMWTAVPAVWMWIAGRYSRVSQSDMSSFVLLYIGIPATMCVLGKGLGRLEGRYAERFGVEAGPRVVGARWLRSLRDDAEDAPPTVLDKILIVNVALALVVFAVWFVLFSGGDQAPRV